MGFWDNILKRDQPVAFFTPNVTYLGAEDAQSMLLGDFTPAQMWSAQPHLRTVVSFLARNIAQLGLHSFQRDGEDRSRDRESVFARTMRRPNEDQTAFDLVFGLVGDIALYDRAYWLTVEDANSPSGWTFRRLPPPWVTPIARDAFGSKAYKVLSPQGLAVEAEASQILAFTGYHPSNPRIGSPTVEALKGTLQEQIEASKYRNQVWKRGGRVSAVLQRPKDAPEWSDAAREQFREDWYAKYTGNGAKAGGTPILEDGMTLNRVDFTAAEQQFVESAKLSFATVAAAFHVNPTMVGILDNANYSNVREFRRMLYGDTLGPIIAMIEDRINTFLLPRLGMDSATYYAEFNIGEKLQGSFEEQAAVMQTLVGAPLMTRNEGRAKFNLTAIDGGDALVTPLNVLVGGQASATDSGSQNTTPKGVAAKAHGAIAAKAATDTQREKVEQVLAAFFKRQGAVVMSAIGADRDWWDAKRWDAELTDDLLRISHTLADILGKAEASRLGYADGYNADQTVDFLRAVAERKASGINETTQAQVADQIADPDGDPASVFQKAQDSRASGVASGVATFVAGFAAVEAAAQIAYREGVTPTKTWITGSNPRSEHAAMDGETVSLDDNFSDGSKWPGDGPESAGCNCSVDISIP
ncbi:MAG: phage portal protein [Nocardioides sp.]|nr:phage portal protein [Nocardioides sp.]